MKQYQADIVVVAAGPAGLAAAVQAAENGARVIVCEKTAMTGGAANMGMGPLGIGTRYQRQEGKEITLEKAFNMFMEYTHYNVDARLVRRYFAQSADTLDWLEGMGVEFEGAFRYFPQSEATWHIVKTDKGIGPRAAAVMNKALYNRAVELGVHFLLKTPVQKILKEGPKVCGVLATDRDGEAVQIDCKAAIICTGGAGGNKQMILEETGYRHGEDLFSFAIPGLVGDGLRMAWEAGADHMPVRMEGAASVEGCEGLSASVSSVFYQPNLLVNWLGERVMNEEQASNSTFLHNVVSHQKDKICFSVLDRSIVEHYEKDGVDVRSLVRPNPDVSDFCDNMEKAREQGNTKLYQADSLRELAEKMGIDPERFEQTVTAYNGYCETGDTEFFKDKRFLLPIWKAPFYAARIRPSGYGTVGGIRINENCEACGPDFYPIPGLYAAGADACNIYDDSYMFLLPGNSMGFAINSGRIAGMSAAEYVSGKGLSKEE